MIGADLFFSLFRYGNEKKNLSQIDSIIFFFSYRYVSIKNFLVYSLQLCFF